MLFLEACPTAGRRRLIAYSFFILTEIPEPATTFLCVSLLFETRLAQTCPLADWHQAGLLLAVSGGPDSVALACALAAWAEDRSPSSGRLVLAHYNHRLRGAGSDADQQFVVRLAEQLALPLCLGQRQWEGGTPRAAAAPLPAEAEPAPTSPGVSAGRQPAGHAGQRGSQSLASPSPSRRLSEAALRGERYRFLLQTAVAHGLCFVAVAHTADDQAETILHRLLRGTGIHGLAGMPPSRSLGSNVTLVRPLLGFRRRDVLEYLAQRGQAYCLDASNIDLGYTRNRLRRQLLPMLQAEYNPRVVEALLRLGEQAQQLSQLAQHLGTAFYDQALIGAGPSGFSLDGQVLATQPPAVVREALAHGWRRLAWPEGAMNAKHWQRLVQMVLDARTPRRYSLPGGIVALRHRNQLTLSRPAASPTGRADSPGSPD